MELKNILQQIWDSLFPGRCPGCGSYAAGGSWCTECLRQVLRPRRLPLAAGSSLAECFAAARYSGTVRQLLQGIKYRGRRADSRFLTDLLNHLEFDLTDYDMVVPIPLHNMKQQQRGYNQTAEIFKPWCLTQQGIWCECLLRQKDTRPQYSLSRREREQNMQGAFIISKKWDIRGKKILLTDDIFTSGATVNEAAQLLKKAGALKISALAAASDAN